MNGDMEPLTQRRRKWVEANQENSFEEGIKRLLTELYPDNAHFIYELLQNAEDTGATEVRFTLDPKAVDFEHNGSRLFSTADVDAITSIDISTKRDDPTSIGKFGVGFKAVFAYTNTPEIHSGNSISASMISWFRKRMVSTDRPWVSGKPVSSSLSSPEEIIQAGVGGN